VIFRGITWGDTLFTTDRYSIKHVTNTKLDLMDHGGKNHGKLAMWDISTVAEFPAKWRCMEKMAHLHMDLPMKRDHFQ
jgi:hypothetical protein